MSFDEENTYFFPFLNIMLLVSVFLFDQFILSFLLSDFATPLEEAFVILKRISLNFVQVMCLDGDRYLLPTRMVHKTCPHKGGMVVELIIP